MSRPAAPVTTPYDDAFFAALGTDDRSASLVWPHVLSLIDPASVVDVGCGIGTWLRSLTGLHDCEVLGIGGDYVPPNVAASLPDRFLEHDLARPLRLDRTFDLATCLRGRRSTCPMSGPPASSPTSPRSPGRPVLGSRAGTGRHRPRRTSSGRGYWVDLFAQVGYKPFDVIRPAIWQEDDVAWWYRQNLLLFADEGADGEPVRPGHVDSHRPRPPRARVRRPDEQRPNRSRSNDRTGHAHGRGRCGAPRHPGRTGVDPASPQTG